MRKLSSILVILVLVFVLTGCSNENVQNDTVNNNVSSVEQTNTLEEEETVNNIDFEGAALKQMAIPEKGEQIATFHIKDYGIVKVKFFEEIAPKAVENFVTHAKEGYYNGVTFHRVINEFMIQGGDPEGTGRGGESIWGQGFEEELSYELVPYRGSLCMASAGTGTSSLGSQFFITQANYSDEVEPYLRQGGYPEELIKEYQKSGGYLSLYLNYTVFGQVFEGMEVVDKIASVETYKDKEKKDKPVKDVIIEKIEISTYE